MPGPSQKFLLLAALLALVAAAGCKPKIGDECQISTDCSAQGDRLCDITTPAGYCTVFNCEPGACPEDESLCVEFGAQRSAVDECHNEQSPSPYARTFCMATCESDSDCRDDYECVDLRTDASQTAYGAVLIDNDRGGRACLVPQTAMTIAADGAGDVCHTELPDEEPDATSGGAGPGTGAGGMSSAGMSGASAEGGGSGSPATEPSGGVGGDGG